MAFTLEAIFGSTTVNLANDNPFGLLAARGLGGAPVRRVSNRGPMQHGDTDLGYRLQPRTIELELGFRATTDAILDGHRDTLTRIFRPWSSTPVVLRVTRDDGAVRQLDCHRVGDITIDLVPDQRAAHYHRATVRLYAPEPAFYAPAPGTVAGSAPIVANWYLAGGIIPGTQVLMHGSVPGTSEVWSYTGTVPATQSFELAIRAGSVPAAGSTAYMFRGVGNFGTPQPSYYRVTDEAGIYAGIPSFRVRDVFAGGALAGTQNYFYKTIPSINYVNFQSTGLNISFPHTDTIVGTAMRWRDGGWPGTIAIYALYSPSLTSAQKESLVSYMNAQAGGTVSRTAIIPYAGDLPEYPTISITGPVTSPSVTNEATGETLSFGTISIGAGTTYVIDTRPNYKTVLQGTINRRSQLAAASDLETWHLAPAPLATGGTNVISFYGTGAGTATAIQVVYYNRYQGL